jgi:hypothetical protein
MGLRRKACDYFLYKGEKTMNITEITNPILAAILPVLVAAIAGALVVWAKTRWEAYKAKQPDIADTLARYAKIAIEAAGQALNDNPARKAYAVKLICAWLDQIGIHDVPVDLIDAEIERQVGIKKTMDALYRGGGA